MTNNLIHFCTHCKKRFYEVVNKDYTALHIEKKIVNESSLKGLF